MKITYLAQYANSRECGDRYLFSPGGVAKMDYFLYCFTTLGIETNVYSSCPSKKKVSFPRHGKSTYGQSVTYAMSFHTTIKGFSILLLFILQTQLFFRMLLSKKDEIFFVYHERFYAPVIKFVRRLRKLSVVIDIEEIYSIHAQLSLKKIRSEIAYLKSFDKYTIANINLANELNLHESQYAICNGVYAPIIPRKEDSTKEYTSVLYAGTFNTTKGGAAAAINAFRLLNKHYKLYVCGFGTNAEIEDIKKQIDFINSEKSYTSIIYEGYVPNTSQRYAELLKRCDIGLSTQNNVGKYNATSFPSKIFEYMRHGIKVVSTSIPGTENLHVSKNITFIGSNTAENVAEGIIRSSSIDDSDECETLINLHNEFIKKISILFKM